jgi:uracil-DNA glycosylase family 4
MIDIEELGAQICSCQACVAAGFLPVARPVFRGVTGRRWMAVGQAPAALGHERPAYAGAAGVKLRAWLREAGLGEEDPLEENFYLTSVTKCFPGPGAGGKGDRMPSRAEVALCAVHLEREIALVRPEVVVTLGKLAANVLAGPGSLAKLVGSARECTVAGQTFTVIPFPHPSGVSRWLNGEPGRSCLQRAIATLRDRLDLSGPGRPEGIGAPAVEVL